MDFSTSLTGTKYLVSKLSLMITKEGNSHIRSFLMTKSV
jgi:hypothetical protein